MGCFCNVRCCRRLYIDKKGVETFWGLNTFKFEFVIFRWLCLDACWGYLKSEFAVGRFKTVLLDRQAVASPAGDSAESHVGAVNIKNSSVYRINFLEVQISFVFAFVE